MPPGKPSYDRQPYVDAHYPRDVTEAVTVTVDGPRGPAQLAALPRQIERVARGRPRHPLRPAPGGEVAYANFALAEPALERRPRTR